MVSVLAHAAVQGHPRLPIQLALDARQSAAAGGAAAAYSASLAIGLIYKVIVREIERGERPEIGTNLLTIKREIERLLKDVEKLVREDPELYTKFAR